MCSYKTLNDDIPIDVSIRELQKVKEQVKDMVNIVLSSEYCCYFLKQFSCQPSANI